ncbi:U6 snRNA-associated Sm-like protein LSm1 [Rhopilema esculentum]|uniref:U6 snRNA-associated Sm-like protein LSm1 n=1 Tax=Rhopilema esculentum TaxID=499914 RepID=UPI0031DC129D|eukprot:gene16361-7758_t
MDSVFVPGALGLIGELDKKLLVVMRDGRTLIGILRSVDQFSNLLLQETIERIHVGKEYGDIHRGIYLVRGENIVLLGEIDDEKEVKSPLREVSVKAILEAQNEEQNLKEEKEKAKYRARLDRGLAPYMPDMGLDDYS